MPKNRVLIVTKGAACHPTLRIHPTDRFGSSLPRGAPEPVGAHTDKGVPADLRQGRDLSICAIWKGSVAKADFTWGGT
ncbi:hypothetical protein ACVIWV_004718 [Bradyrhizobium diazoefficiens]|jgi:hypothetical protein|uniref:Uncharacterized protein n=1 Tax=Bradyrhizobium diazoefficiens TaxID=1355477 RepID=A0A0E3VW45_9BRAD|nr:hypothetical protein [Bradyrhizobium diazoefficiens]MBR0861080.1 hypothetical protein [Bradyrhizobium diazoefficiens]MBR0885435.1 hypothetical protein [Bradyrhizobium diazoefficiens]MBR0917328.1 hypothetical protein [Bradyrhizobium diazoefficiens]WLA59328.1 hypothetical protein QIH81_11835 [Bradyrhizobium diazoefficiens]WLA62974.1 hypothetical protein QNN01_31765 [Bradyrhizobium diazoefficiens]